MFINRGILLFLFAIAAAGLIVEVSALGVAQHSPGPLERIAFGSCSKSDRPQPLWRPIRAYHPQLWVWLGDNVYNDEQKIPPIVWRSRPLEAMKENYEQQKRVELYSALRHDTPIIGTWDDHDYGENDGDSSYADKKESQKLMLDFLDEHRDSPRHHREGVYNAWTFGEPPRQVKVILLDVRYFKNETSLLGDEQWTWLEHELSTSQAQINFIGSGIQVLGVEKPFEKWFSHPGEFLRLMDVLNRSKANGVIFLSGDVHYAQAYALKPPCSPTGYVIHEFGSSGMTHSCDDIPFGLCRKAADNILHSQYHDGPMITEKNYGTLQIDWGKRTLTEAIHNATGHVVDEHVVLLDDLKFNSDLAAKNTSECWPERSSSDWRQLKPLDLAQRVLAGLSIVFGLSFALFLSRMRKRDKAKVVPVSSIRRTGTIEVIDGKKKKSE